jgi:hypothetical protein
MSTNISEVRAASIITLMMEAAHTSEMSIDIQSRTRQYMPEDSELHTCHYENLKSHDEKRGLFTIKYFISKTDFQCTNWPVKVSLLSVETDKKYLFCKFTDAFDLV